MRGRVAVATGEAGETDHRGAHQCSDRGRGFPRSGSAVAVAMCMSVIVVMSVSVVVLVVTVVVVMPVVVVMSVSVVVLVVVVLVVSVGVSVPVIVRISVRMGALRTVGMTRHHDVKERTRDERLQNQLGVL
ncbi:MAG: hypothetical protein AAF938_27455 [Myxococcota bacterium]